MQDLIRELLLAVVTVCLPIITAYVVKAIKKLGDNAAADTEDLKISGYIDEITQAITQAVSSTSQTYVDSLKESGEFTIEAQKIALQKSIETAKAILSPAVLEFIDNVYGDFVEYVTPKIEAEVRKQKLDAPVELSVAEVNPSETATAAVAASTAAATAAITQTALKQLNAGASENEAAKGEKREE